MYEQTLWIFRKFKALIQRFLGVSNFCTDHKAILFLLIMSSLHCGVGVLLEHMRGIAGIVIHPDGRKLWNCYSYATDV